MVFYTSDMLKPLTSTLDMLRYVCAWEQCMVTVIYDQGFYVLEYFLMIMICTVQSLMIFCIAIPFESEVQYTCTAVFKSSSM